MSFTADFLGVSRNILDSIDEGRIEEIVVRVAEVKERQGRIFFAGSGGGAGHASHATCDFRKILDIESYCISDNASELTARINDESWSQAMKSWLATSRLGSGDLVFFFSVGGGSRDPKVSENLILAAEFALSRGAEVAGVLGRDGGELAKLSPFFCLIPVEDSRLVTPQTEGFQALVWHLIVSHPKLSPNSAHWEALVP